MSYRGGHRAARSTGSGMLVLIVLALIALALALAGCRHAPTHGTVYMKETTPANDYTYTTMVCTYYGKYGCQIWVPIIHTQRVPQRWELCISKDSDDDSDAVPSGCLFVDQATYARFEIGQHYPS